MTIETLAPMKYLCVASANPKEYIGYYVCMSCGAPGPNPRSGPELLAVLANTTQCKLVSTKLDFRRLSSFLI